MTAPMSKPDSGRIRLSAEEVYAHELFALAAGDKLPRPANWRVSPQAVVTYILGGKAADGSPISAKYIGNRRLIETAVATLATDRALCCWDCRERRSRGYRNIWQRRFRAPRNA